MHETYVTILQMAFWRGLTIKVFKITELSNAEFYVIRSIIVDLKSISFELCSILPKLFGVLIPKIKITFRKGR